MNIFSIELQNSKTFESCLSNTGHDTSSNRRDGTRRPKRERITWIRLLHRQPEMRIAYEKA